MTFRQYLGEETVLDEALGNLSAIPSAWIKKLKSKNIGENSKILPSGVHQSVSGVGALDELVRKLCDQNEVVGQSKMAGIFITINGAPFMLMSSEGWNGQMDRFGMINAEGSKLVIKDTRIAPWSNKMSGGQYVPPHYNHFDRSNMNKTELISNFKHALMELTPDGKGPLNKQFFADNSIGVSMIYWDMDRIAKHVDREASRSGRNSDISNNKKEVLRKYIESNISDITKDLQDEINSAMQTLDLQSALNSALNGQPVGVKLPDFKGVQEKIYTINSIFSQVASVMKSDTVKFAEKEWRSEKYSAVTTLKSLLQNLKKLKDGA